jgi:hypothetical protein
MLFYDAEVGEVQKELENDKPIETGAEIVNHNADTLGTQALKHANGRRLNDIKKAKEQKARKLRLEG